MFKKYLSIPVRIQPFFWILAGLIGFFNTSSLWGMLLWVLVIFISVLFHEYGHAIAAKFFGKNPSISLVAFGGATTYETTNLKFWQQFIIVFAGPLFGIILFFISFLVLYLNIFQNAYIVSFFQITKLVNFFWTIINLIPVQPLDGGQLLRILLEGFFGVKGFKFSFFIGAIISVIISIFFFIKGGFLIGAIFFLFAFQSFDMWRKSRYITSEDRNLNKATLLLNGEKALAKGDIPKAKEIFENIIKNTKKGMLQNSAKQFLALIYYKQQKIDQAYDLLKSIEENISDESKCVLHNLAFLVKDFETVAKYSSNCYQLAPNMDIAIKNAKAFAVLNDPKSSGGWMQTASQFEGFDLEKLLNEKEFENIKNNDLFHSFIDKI